MITVSDNLRELLNADSRTFRVKLVVGSDTYEEILTLKKTVIFPSSAMSLGNALSACIECTVANVPASSIKDKEIEVNMTVADCDEWIKLGKFTAEKPTVQNGNVSFTAYDKMTCASNKTYNSNLTEGEHTAQEYFSDICFVIGVGCVTLPVNIGSLSIPSDKLSGYSCRDALAYLAGFLGRNCIVNRDGLFEMITFTVTDYTMLNADRITEPELSDSDCVIGYISCCVDNETTLLTGEGSSGFEFISPIMTQERLDSIGIELMSDSSDIRVYKSGKVTQLLGDPTLEVCDIVTLNYGANSFVFPIMSLMFDYDGGLQAEIESFEFTESNSLALGERLDFAQKQAQEKTDTYIKAVVEFSEAMQKAYGVSHTMIDGITYFHNSADIDEAEYIFCLTSEGLAFTSGKNCWGGSHENTVWQYGLSSDGEAVLKMLKVFHLTADLITAGKLQSKDGYTYFDLENDEIVTTTSDDEGNVLSRISMSRGELSCVDETGSNFQTVLNSAGVTSVNSPINTKALPEKPDNWDELGLIQKLIYLIRLLEQYRKGQCLLSPYTTEVENVYLNHSNPRANQMIKFDNELNALATTEYTAEGINSDVPFRIPNLTNFKRELTSADNLNLLTEEGVYVYRTGNVPSGCPYSNAGVVEVVNTGSDMAGVLQRITRYGVAGQSSFRAQSSSGWSEWADIATTDKTLTSNVVSTASTNLNDYTIPGCYFFTGNYTPTNIPAGTNGWLLVLTNNATKFIKQVWFRAGTSNSNDQQTFVRTYVDGVWSGWKTLAVVLTKTVTGTTNSNGNIVLGIGDDYAPISLKCSNACLATAYYSESSGGSWRAHITSAADNSNIASTEVTVTCRYVYAPTWLNG